MCDALAPAVDALERSLADDGSLATALTAARYAARTGRDATTPMLARKGRATYLGEPGIGEMNPGAAGGMPRPEGLAVGLRGGPTDYLDSTAHSPPGHTRPTAYVDPTTYQPDE